MSVIDRILPGRLAEPGRIGESAQVNARDTEEQETLGERRTSSHAGRSLIHCDITKAGEEGVEIDRPRRMIEASTGLIYGSKYESLASAAQHLRTVAFAFTDSRQI